MLQIVFILFSLLHNTQELLDFGNLVIIPNLLEGDRAGRIVEGDRVGQQIRLNGVFCGEERKRADVLSAEICLPLCGCATQLRR